MKTQRNLYALDYMRISVRFIVGIGLSVLMALETVEARADPVNALEQSAQEAQGPKVEDYKGVFLWGLQAGGAYVPQNIHTSTTSGWGTYVSGNALYGFWPNILLGMDIDYYRVPFNVQSNGFNLGADWTVSVLPMVEFRTNRMGNWSLYGNIGIGMNDNNFLNSSGLNAACGSCSIDMQISFAARFALGADYYVTKNLSATAEVGYMMNDTPAIVTVSAPGYSASGGETLNLSTMFVLVGFHYNGTP